MIERTVWASCFVLSACTIGCGSDGSSSGDSGFGGNAGSSGSSNAGSSNAGSSNAGSSNGGSNNGGSSNGGSSNGGSSSGGGGSGGNTFAFPDPPGAAPTLAPELVALTYAGGEGDQQLTSVSIDSEGRVTANGNGFSVVYDGGSGSLEGDAASNDDSKFQDKPDLPGSPGKLYSDPRHDLDLRVGYRQAGGNLQMPIFRAFEPGTDDRLWILWGHAVADATDGGHTADSRCYQAWAMPQGNVGVQCWTDGGNSVLAKDPRDLSVPGYNPTWAAGSYQHSAGGMSSMYALVDPSDGGRVLSGTFMANHVTVLAVDEWGRVYLARTVGSRSGGADPTNPFGQAGSASSGFATLSATLADVLSNMRIGGTNCDGGKQAFGSIAYRDGTLALAGTTCAPDLATVNAAQSSHGGGQDGMLAVIKLW